MSKQLLRNFFPLRGMLALAAVMLMAAGCKNDDDHRYGEIEQVVPETEIFITEATGAAQSRTIDDPKTPLPVTVCLGKALSTDVSFTLDADAEWVDKYNAEHGTDWALLPATGREMTVKRTIPAGATTSDPIDLKITLPVDANVKTYVLPVYLADVAGAAAVKESQSHLVYLFVKGNFVYIEQAADGGKATYEIPYETSATIPFGINLADPLSADITATLQLDPSLIDKYNEEHGTQYQMLPPEYYTWAANGSVTIKAGQTSANADIAVSSLPSGKYAIGLSLVSISETDGVKVKEDQHEWLYLLRHTPIPAIQHSVVFTNFTGVSGMPTVAINETLEQWTFEYWVKHDDNSALSTATYDWLDASDNSAEWRKRVYPPQSAPAKLPSPIDFMFWPQGNQNLSPMMQFTNQKTFSASIHNDGFAFMPDEWTHLAFTYDATEGTLKYYVNGVQYGIGSACTAGAQDFLGMSATYANATTWGTLTLATPGVSTQTFYKYYKIEMAQIRLWNRVLESDEIKENMGLSLDSAEVDGLVRYWKMDEGSGTTLSEATGNGNDISSAKVAWSTEEYDFSKE